MFYCVYGQMSEIKNYYYYYNIFESIYYIIVSKYTLKYTQLNPFFKKFSSDHTPKAQTS